MVGWIDVLHLLSDVVSGYEKGTRRRRRRVRRVGKLVIRKKKPPVSLPQF